MHCSAKNFHSDLNCREVFNCCCTKLLIPCFNEEDLETLSVRSTASVGALSFAAVSHSQNLTFQLRFIRILSLFEMSLIPSDHYLFWLAFVLL